MTDVGMWSGSHAWGNRARPASESECPILTPSYDPALLHGVLEKTLLLVRHAELRWASRRDCCKIRPLMGAAVSAMGLHWGRSWDVRG